jgi:ABC-type glycerol-3-phosphate transport system substrate-binding protein
MLAGLLLLLPRRKWLRRRRLLMVVAMLAGVAGLSGCGGACTDLGTLPGTYTVTVVATASGGTVESQKVVMKVLVP